MKKKTRKKFLEIKEMSHKLAKGKEEKKIIFDFNLKK
jgi:hypothetical protein